MNITKKLIALTLICGSWQAVADGREKFEFGPGYACETVSAAPIKRDDITADAPCKITIESMGNHSPVVPKPKKIALVRIEGELKNLGVKAGRLYQQALKDDVVGVVVCINSNGGEGGASEIVQNAMDFVKRRQKPVFIHVDTKALSAGYSMACAGSKIYAGKFSRIGGIGVVQSIPGPEEARKQANWLMAGHHKYAAWRFTPQGELTEESRAKIVVGIEKSYRLFRQDVAERRQIPVAKIDSWEAADFYGQEALELGLIDAVGALDQAIMDLRAEIKKRPENAEVQQFVLVDEDDKELGKL